MRIVSWLYYILDRRLGDPRRFERLYALDPDPFGCEVLRYEIEKRNAVLELLWGKSFSHILDIGCGTGTLTRALANSADTITAIDFSSRAIEIAREKTDRSANISYQHSDLRDIVFSRQYDLILCSEVLYYLQENELVTFLDKICASQSGETLLISVGKINDPFVPKILGKRLRQINRIKKKHNRRPYGIDVYKIS